MVGKSRWYEGILYLPPQIGEAINESIVIVADKHHLTPTYYYNDILDLGIEEKVKGRIRRTNKVNFGFITKTDQKGQPYLEIGVGPEAWEYEGGIKRTAEEILSRRTTHEVPSLLERGQEELINLFVENLEDKLAEARNMPLDLMKS